MLMYNCNQRIYSYQFLQLVFKLSRCVMNDRFNLYLKCDIRGSVTGAESSRRCVCVLKVYCGEKLFHVTVGLQSNFMACQWG